MRFRYRINLNQLNDSLPGLLLDLNLRIITFQEREEKKTKIMMKTAYTFRSSSRRDYKLPMMQVASSLPEGEGRTVLASFRSPVAQLYLPDEQVYLSWRRKCIYIIAGVGALVYTGNTARCKAVPSTPTPLGAPFRWFNTYKLYLVSEYLSTMDFKLFLIKFEADIAWFINVLRFFK